MDFNNGCSDTYSNVASPTQGTPVTLTSTQPVNCDATPVIAIRTAGPGGIDISASKLSIQSVDTTVTPASTSASGYGSGAWASFDTSKQTDVQMQVAISYVSIANAKANLEAEQGAKPDFRSIQAKTRAEWNHLLSRIAVGGGTTDQLTQFYTALYHSLLAPNIFSDADGSYIGFDNKIHQIRAGQGAQYANFSDWDTYRDLWQLLALTVPSETGDMSQSLVNDAVQGGWLPKVPMANDYNTVINGDSAGMMIADAYAFGVRNFDVKTALSFMLKGATKIPAASELGHGFYDERPQLADYLQRGYTPNTQNIGTAIVPNGASQTLEYAADDFAIAQMAKSLGQNSVFTSFMQRAQNWETLLNPSTKYLQPRDAQGFFPPGDPLTTGFAALSDPFQQQSGFQEGNVVQYSWAVPQNISALTSLIGGKSEAMARLDQFFTQLNAGPGLDFYWGGNEVNFNAPWVYDYLGAPYKTQGTVRRIATGIYSNKPGGLPGNDDLGATSAWLIWSYLGLYPQTPASPVLAVGSPLFQSAVFHLPGHRTLQIHATDAGAENPYVTSLAVNGHSTERTWLSAADLLKKNTVLSFGLSASPNTAWGTSPADAPPSYSTGESPAVIAPTGSEAVVAPGASTEMALTAANATDKPLNLQWTVQAPAGSGLTMSLASGNAVLPAAGGQAAINPEISAAADAPQAEVTLTVKATANGVPMPDREVSVLVGTNMLGSTGTLAWSGPNNNACSNNSDSLTSTNGGLGEKWVSSCVSAQTSISVTPPKLTIGKTYQTSVTLTANSSKQTAPMFLVFNSGCSDTTSITVWPKDGQPVTVTDTQTLGCAETGNGIAIRAANSGGVDLTVSDLAVYQIGS
jgi:predicted alpha-1,2-mannosidase